MNKLSINFNNTEFMVVTTKQNKPELKVSIANICQQKKIFFKRQKMLDRL